MSVCNNKWVELSSYRSRRSLHTVRHSRCSSLLPPLQNTPPHHPDNELGQYPYISSTYYPLDPAISMFLSLCFSTFGGNVSMYRYIQGNVLKSSGNVIGNWAHLNPKPAFASFITTLHATRVHRVVKRYVAVQYPAKDEALKP